MKIGNTADLHFRGGPMLSVIGAEWRELHAEGHRRGIDAIVVAGDVFDDPCLALGRDASAGDVAAAIIEPILEFGIETIVLPGNHDWRFGRKSALELLRGIPNVRIVDRPEIVQIRRGDEVVHLAILPWIWNSHLRSLPEYQDLPHGEFAAVAAQKRRAILSGFAAQWHGERGFKMLAGHAEVEGSRNRYMELPAGSTQVFTQNDLGMAGADAVVLGHVHLRQLDYVGSLVQQNFGEQDNPTGWLLIDTATGAREFVENRSPRHYTVTADAFRALEYRPGVDKVKIRDVEQPRVDEVTLALPEGVRFEKLVQPKETRLRVEGITADASTETLLRAWLPLRHPDEAVEPLMPTLHRMLEHVEIRSKEGEVGGAVEAIREIRLRNVGPHVETHLVVPADDGLMAIVGQNGAGKTMLLEAFCAAVYGEMPFYPGPLYDLTREGFTGEALIEVVFEADGRTFRARRALRISAKTRTQEAYLFEITADGDRALAGPKTAEFESFVRPLVGDKETFFATVFQGQNDVGSIIDADPADRMQFARRWVGADRYEQAAGWCKLEAATVLGGVAQQERWLQEQGDVAQRVVDVEARLAGEAAWVARIDQQIEGAEGQLQIERDARAEVEARIARFHEASRHVETLERGARELEADIAAAQAAIDRDRAQLAREPELQARVGELAGLRVRHAEALRQNEMVAAARARQAALQSECGRLRQAIASVVADARARVELERQRVRQEAAEIEHAISQRRSAHAASEAQLQAEEVRLIARIKEVERAAVVQVERQREALRQIIRELQREIDRERALYEATAQAKRLQIVGLEGKARLLDGAGCRETPLACRFLSDAAAAPQQIAALQAELRAAETALAVDDYAHEARARRAEHEQVLAGLVDPDLEALAPELRAELAGVRERLVAAAAPVDASDLSDRLSAAEARLRGVVDVDAAGLAGDLRAELATREAEAAAVLIPQAVDLSILEREIRLREGAERELGGLVELRRAVEVRVAELDAKSASLRQRQAELSSARLELGQQAGCFREREQIDERMARVNADLQRLRRTAAEGAERVGAVRAELEAARELVARVERVTAELRPRREEAARLSRLAEAFGPTGVPQLLIDIAIPALNDILADLVSDMDEPVHIEFTTQRQLKGGGCREGLWINVTDVGGTRDIRRHSCGEQGFLRKVVRQAMGLFSAQRRGRHHRIYCVDEPTLGLDETNVPRLLGIIYRLATRFRQVWIVSHDSVLLQGIPIHFRLDRVNGVSRLHGAAPVTLPESVTA